MYICIGSRHGGGDEAGAWLNSNGCIYLSKVRGLWQVSSRVSLEDADQRSVQSLPCCQVRRGDGALWRKGRGGEKGGKERRIHKREDTYKGVLRIELGMREQTIFMQTKATIVASSTTDELHTSG